MNMPMHCGNTEAEIAYDRRMSNIKPVQQVSALLLASELCYGEDVGLNIYSDTKLTHAHLVESVINSDEFAKALIAIHKNDLTPLQDLMMECAEGLINKARGL